MADVMKTKSVRALMPGDAIPSVRVIREVNHTPTSTTIVFDDGTTVVYDDAIVTDPAVEIAGA